MKKAKIMAAIVALCAGVVFAALDTYDTVTVKSISTLKVASGVQTNAAVDVAAAKGVCNFIVAIGPAYTNAANFGASATLRHCASSTGTFLPVTNGAAAEVTVTGAGVAGTGAVTSVKVEAEKLLRYVKLFTVATNDQCDIGAVLLYSK
jgi:hypothetical protein